MGVKCPRCTKVTALRRDRRLRVHKSPYGEWCPYGGGTYSDAENRITTLARRLLDTGHVKNVETGKWEKVNTGEGD
jgi:hypothetical protein